ELEAPAAPREEAPEGLEPLAGASACAAQPAVLHLELALLVAALDADARRLAVEMEHLQQVRERELVEGPGQGPRRHQARRVRLARALEHVAHAQHDLFLLERLRDEVVGADLEAVRALG